MGIPFIQQEEIIPTNSREEELINVINVLKKQIDYRDYIIRLLMGYEI